MKNSNPPICLKIRGGVEVDSKGNKAGKGPLLSENLSMTLGTSQDQYLFQPIVIDPVGGQAERAWQTDVSPMLKATHYKFPPAIMMSAGFKPGQGAKAKGMGWEMEKSPTLLAGQEPGVCISFEPGALKRLGNSISRNISGTLRATMGDNQMAVAYSVENHPSDSRYRINDSGIVQTLRSRMGTGGGNEPIVMLEQKTFDARGNGDGETTSTITGDHENRVTDYTNVIVLRLDNGSAYPVVCGDKSPTIRRGNGPGGTGHVAVCFQQNQRDEVRIMEKPGAIMAQPGMKCQNFIAEVINLNKGDVQSKAVIDPNGIAPALYAGECRGGGGEMYIVDMGGGKSSCNVSRDKTPTLACTHGGEPVVCLEGNGSRPSHQGDGYRVADKMYTLNTIDRHAVCYGISSMGSNAMLSDNPHSGIYEAKTSRTLDLNGGNPACNQGGIIVCQPRVVYPDKTGSLMASGYSKNGTQEAMNGMYVVCYWDGTQTTGTLTANNAGGSQRMPDKENFNCVIQRYPKSIHDFVAENNSDAPHQQDLLQTADGVARTLAASTHGAAPHLTKTVIKMDNQYIVRRLTPTECCRLQGFPDGWGEIDPKEDFTDEEYRFWLDVRNTHAAINGKKTGNYTKDQMLTWYNKLHSDSNEYKMWGNGIALPNALYVMEGIAEELEKMEVTKGNDV